MLTDKNEIKKQLLDKILAKDATDNEKEFVRLSQKAISEFAIVASNEVRQYAELFFVQRGIDTAQSIAGFYDEYIKAENVQLQTENEALKNEIAHLKLVISRFQTGGEG